MLTCVHKGDEAGRPYVIFTVTVAGKVLLVCGTNAMCERRSGKFWRTRKSEWRR